MGLRAWLLAVTVLLAACGSQPSLSGPALQEKYPDKKYIDIDGVALHYDQQGLGRPMVLLHGLGASSYVWRNIIPA